MGHGKMKKEKILAEIKRIADANQGKPPGTIAFERETGISKKDWWPAMWLRWSDALVEAGYSPNIMQAAIPEEVLILKYISLTRELKHIPVEGEMIRKHKLDASFPLPRVFCNRFKGKKGLIKAVLDYCQEYPDYKDVCAFCWQSKHLNSDRETGGRDRSRISTGFVYLMKSGRHFKIGYTSCVGSRQRQLAIKIPVPPKTVHAIETDDPVGVEAYWHKRFREKRGEGEWFNLSPEDVRAFKRWKRIV
jgi:hypothetical protein